MGYSMFKLDQILPIYPNLILATVYNSFKYQLVKQVAGMDSMRKHTLEKAFRLLDKDSIRDLVNSFFMQVC
ncbi:hypothetical protein GIB67_039164 [Kingdonia uniflora]|uniref:Uncharacterized protein n=1 Tax=Kingdonia uniflora TaxID=39325 RepID=A0A7J7MLR4_9MAGN|nr:hypothetical protein GIB67_039164 [Kingdonia uniflora]